MLLRSILCGGVWTGFLLSRAKGDDVRWWPGWRWAFVLGLHISSLSLCPLWRVIVVIGLCLPWHGWLPGLSVAGERTPLADSLGQLVDRSLSRF